MRRSTSRNVTYGLIASIAIYVGATQPVYAVRGINYGWCRYSGWSTWLTSSYGSTSSVMNSDFSLIHQSGKIGSVRIWIFPDGQSNVSLTSTVSSTLRNNLKSVVSAANSHGLSVYLTFFSSWTPGYATTANEAALWTYDVNPILSDMIGHYNVFGIDVMNEFDGTGNNLPFVTYMIGKVKGSYNIYVTASSNQSYSKAVSDRSSDGANFIDLHIYANPNITLPQNTSGYMACIGEIGDSGGNAANHTTVDEQALTQLSSKGWSHIFGWDFALDDAFEMTNAGTGFGTVSWNSVGSDWASY